MAIAVTRKTLDANGGYVSLVHPPGVKGDASGSVQTTEMTYRVLPPKEVVVSSGHANGGKRVTFGLKRTPQDTLEERKMIGRVGAEMRAHQARRFNYGPRGVTDTRYNGSECQLMPFRLSVGKRTVAETGK